MNPSQEGMTLKMKVKVAKLKKLARERPNTYLCVDLVRHQRIQRSGLSVVSLKEKDGDR